MIFENDICNGFLKMNGEFFQCVCFGGDGFDDWKRYECGLLMVVVVIGMDMMGLDWYGDWMMAIGEWQMGSTNKIKQNKSGGGGREQIKWIDMIFRWWWLMMMA